MFYDLNGLELGDSKRKLEEANRRKREYGYPSNWSPIKVAEYCSRLCLHSLNYATKKSILREDLGEIIPCEHSEDTLGFEPWTISLLTINELEKVTESLRDRDCVSIRFSFESESDGIQIDMLNLASFDLGFT
jgi:hypothetical protein